MKRRALEDLASVTELAYQRALDPLRHVLQREAAALSRLAELDQQAAQVRAAPHSVDLMRPLGADLVWEQWLGRARKDLNIELAQLRAAKEGHIAHLSRAFGRKLVAEELSRRACASAGKKRRV